MDDHAYERLKEYGECELVPRFNREVQEMLKADCLSHYRNAPSYKEMCAFCNALNAIAPYAGYNPVQPCDFLRGCGFFE